MRGKTDQEAAGQVVGVVATDSLTCPVAALRTWLEAADITDGAVFRAIDRHSRIATGLSDRAIALIVMTAAGVDPTATRRTRSRRLLATIQHDTAWGEQEEWTHKFRYRHRVSPEILVR